MYTHIYIYIYIYIYICIYIIHTYPNDQIRLQITLRLKYIALSFGTNLGVRRGVDTVGVQTHPIRKKKQALHKNPAFTRLYKKHTGNLINSTVGHIKPITSDL